MCAIMLTEAQGCAVLKRVFAARGYHIQENVPFLQDNVSFNADGWDAQRRVGYEFVTRSAGDHLQFTPDTLHALEAWMAADRLYFFIVDEQEIADEAELSHAASAFLDEVERRTADRAHGP